MSCKFVSVMHMMLFSQANTILFLPLSLNQVLDGNFAF